MSQDRLDRLTAPKKERREHNQGYSVFIRRAQLIMPVVAIIIIALVFIWSTTGQESIVAVQQTSLKEQTIGKNELINPRYESRDEKNQPMTITAKRAVQGGENDNLVTLDEPRAHITLEGGDILGGQALSGEYQQDAQKLTLTGEVRLMNDQGYTLDTEKLFIDMVENKAWSDDLIHGKGPDSTLEAKGLRADSVTQDIVFIGPATLILKDAKLGNSFKGTKK